MKPNTRQFAKPEENVIPFRGLPQDPMAEKAVLGSIILSEQAFLTVQDIIKSEDFFTSQHKSVYRAIFNLYERKEPVDMITLSNELKTLGEFERVGLTLLSGLINQTPHAANAEFYANIVAEKSRARNLIKLCTEAVTEAYQDDARKPEMITEDLLTKLVLVEKFLETPTTMEMAARVYEEAVDDKKEILIPTGWEGFDAKVGGIRRGILTTVTGESEVGKSTGVQNVALHVARKKHKVAYIYIDGKPEDLPKRQVCMMNDWSLQKWESRDKTILDPAKKADAIDRWAKLGIRIAGRDQVGNQWKTLKLWMIREWKRNRTDFFVIDGGERVQNHIAFGESRYDAQEKIVDEMEQLAAKLNVGLWVIIGQSKTKQDKYSKVDENEVGTNAWRKYAALRLFVNRDEHDTKKVWVKITKNRNWGGKSRFSFWGTEDTYKWTEIEAATTA